MVVATVLAEHARISTILVNTRMVNSSRSIALSRVFRPLQLALTSLPLPKGTPYIPCRKVGPRARDHLPYTVVLAPDQTAVPSSSNLSPS
jgi:hypothetical protein